MKELAADTTGTVARKQAEALVEDRRQDLAEKTKSHSQKKGDVAIAEAAVASAKTRENGARIAEARVGVSSGPCSSR